MRYKIKNYLTKLLGIDILERDILYLEEQNRILMDLVAECTSVSSDISHKGNQESIVFVAGRFKNKDYTRLFTVQHENMEQLIFLLKDMEKSHQRGFYDISPAARQSFEYFMDRE